MLETRMVRTLVGSIGYPTTLRLQVRGTKGPSVGRWRYLRLGGTTGYRLRTHSGEF